MITSTLPPQKLEKLLLPIALFKKLSQELTLDKETQFTIEAKKWRRNLPRTKEEIVTRTQDTNPKLLDIIFAKKFAQEWFRERERIKTYG